MDYKMLVDVALEIGEVMLKHGAETYRVEDTMTRILRCSKLIYREAYVTYTGIFITLADPSIETITKVKRIENAGANYNKIYLANNLSRDLCDGKITVEEAKEQIKKIREARVYKQSTVAVSMVFIAAMFVPLFGGNVGECLVAGINGMIIVLWKLLSDKMKFPGFITNMVTSVCMAIFTMFVIVVLKVPNLDQGIIITSSIMPLVPGVAITNAIRDTLQGDYMSGGSRAVEALVTATTIAVGIGIGFLLFHTIGEFL